MTRTVEEALTEFADELRRERETNYSVSEAGMLARIEGRLRALASSPPPAAPARDDRGADLWRTLVKTTRVLRALIATKVRGDALEAWVREKGLAHLDEADDVIAKHRDAYARNRARAASSSGEATALRLLALYRAKRAVDGLNGRPWDAVTHLAAEEALAAAGEVADPLASWEARVALRDRIAALAAPSQETETREATAEWTCKHGRNDTTPCPACDGPATEPLAAPAAQRDPEEAPCPECGNEVRHPGTGLLVCECPAPAPSAAPDTGKEPTP
jgi:hypothetical protein